MTPLALGLSLACALGWATLDALRKQLGGRLEASLVVIWISLGTVPVFLLWQLAEGLPRFSWGYLLPGLACAVFNLFANVLFVRSVSLSPLSLTVPLLSLVPAFTLAAGALLLGEWLPARALFGMGLVVLASLGLFQGRGRRNPFAALLNEPGAPLMVLVAVCWAMTAVLDKRSVAHADTPLHALLQNLLVGGGLVLYRRLRGRKTPLPDRRERRWLLAAVLAGGAGLGFQLLAIQHTLVSLMETVKRVVGLVAALLAGRLLFGERITTPQVLAVGLLAAGLWLMLA